MSPPSRRMNNETLTALGGLQTVTKESVSILELLPSIIVAQREVSDRLLRVTDLLESSTRTPAHSCFKTKDLEDIATRLTKIEAREESTAVASSENRAGMRSWQEKQDVMLFAHDQIVYKVTGGWKVILIIAALASFLGAIIARLVPTLVK